jgi:hypothetical protein
MIKISYRNYKIRDFFKLVSDKNFRLNSQQKQFQFLFKIEKLIENGQKKKKVELNEVKTNEVKDYFIRTKKSLLGKYLKKKNVIKKKEFDEEDARRQLKFESEYKRGERNTPISRIKKTNILEMTQNGMMDTIKTKGSMLPSKSPFLKGDKLNKTILGNFLLFNDNKKKPKINKDLIDEYIIIPLVSKNIINKFLNGLSEYQADLSKKINESLGKNEKYFQGMTNDVKNKSLEFKKMMMDRIITLENQNQLLLKYTESLYKKYEYNRDFESKSSGSDLLSNSPDVNKYFN